MKPDNPGWRAEWAMRAIASGPAASVTDRPPSRRELATSATDAQDLRPVAVPGLLGAVPGRLASGADITGCLPASGVGGGRPIDVVRRREMNMRAPLTRVTQAMDDPGWCGVPDDPARHWLPDLRAAHERSSLESQSPPRGGAALIEIRRVRGETDEQARPPGPGTPTDVPGAAALVSQVKGLGIREFLEQLVRNGRVGMVTWNQFQTIWNSDPVTVKWLKAQFRDALRNTHEWIPSNFIREVVDRAITVAGPDRSELEEGLAWLTVHHELRTPTNQVIWYFNVTAAPTRRRSGVLAIGSHAGSFVDHEDFRRGVGGAAGERHPSERGFHEVLRHGFVSSRSLSPTQFVKRMKAHALANVWNGTGIPNRLLDERIGDFATAYYLDNTAEASVDTTLRQVRSAQRHAYDELSQMFDRVLAMVR